MPVSNASKSGTWVILPGKGARSLPGALGLLAVALLLACGGAANPGGPGPSGPTGLTYQDPPGTGYRLVQDSGLSTPTHLVLDLMGPSEGLGRGVAFTLDAGSLPVVWAPVAHDGPRYATNVGFELGGDPQIFLTKVQGSQLAVIMFQKGAGHARAQGTVLCQVALDLQPPASSAGSLPLAVAQFQFLPATGATLTPATCAVGMVSAQ